MEKMIMANHKMNMTLDDEKAFIDSLSKAKFKPIIFPSSLYLPYFIEKDITVGIQNICFADYGAYTGEIGAGQAKSLGCEYVLLGHRERRGIFKETDDEINLKVKRALANDLKVILCVGENVGEDYKLVLKNQIKAGLKDISDEVIISYEPVYSIGTGLILEREEIIEIARYIKSLFDYDVKVIYGGSVNLKTAHELKDIDELSGYLIGTGSLDALEFIDIGEVLM